MGIFSINTDSVLSEQAAIDNQLLANAKDLGIVKPNGALEEDFMIYDMDAILPMNEAEATNPGQPKRLNINTKILRIKRTKAQQMNRLVKRQVLSIASVKNDPAFQKWRKFMDLARKYRQQMNKKYQSRAVSDVRKIISGARSAALGKQATDIQR